MRGGTRLDSQTRRNWMVDATLLAVALASVVTGAYFLFLPTGGYQGGRNASYGITILAGRHTWSDAHAWAGALAIAAVLVHLVLHWPWVLQTTRRIASAARRGPARLSRGSKVNVAVNAAIALGFAGAALSGVYFLFAPAGGFQGGANPGWDPGFLMARSTWNALHTWSGTLFAIAGMLHFAIHWRWVRKVTPRLLRRGAGRQVAVVSENRSA